MKTLLLTLAVLFGLCGCATQGPYPLAKDGSTAGTLDTQVEYPLSSADKVRVTVYNEPTLTGEYTVGANGMIAFPLIGSVKAAGFTAAALGSSLRAQLDDGFVRNPSVSVEVITFRPFYVLGEVNRAGEYPYSAGMSVVQAIASAQGFSYRANRKYIFLKRAGDDHEDKTEITPTLTVRPGDTIRVAERYF